MTALTIIILVRAVFVVVSLTTLNGHVLGTRAVPYCFEITPQKEFYLIVQIINLFVVGTIGLIQSN